MTFEQIYQISSPFTVTSQKRMQRLFDSVVYINEKKIAGDFVECGVYKGGSVMNMALVQLNYPARPYIHLYDTFTGMTRETDLDVNYQGVLASKILRKPSKRCVCSLDQVKKNISLTSYPEQYLHYHSGDVADTLLKDIPEKIALLRLDTDWYESTKKELEVLYPRLVAGGVLILDDYGYWQGARKATNDYFSSIGTLPDFEPIEPGVSAVILIK